MTTEQKLIATAYDEIVNEMLFGFKQEHIQGMQILLSIISYLNRHRPELS